MKIIDISPSIDKNSAIYPGDVAYHRDVSKDTQQGDNYTLSSITTTLHIGAHADAPSHYAKDAETIDQRDLEYYYGPCQVIQVSNQNDNYRLHPEDIEHTTIQAPRILLRTDSFADPKQWHDDFMALSPELINTLAVQGVKLIGIDTPSVDPAQAKELISHHALHQHNMAVLENLVLTAVQPGLYTLIALPLKLKGADASPVRAALLPN